MNTLTAEKRVVSVGEWMALADSYRSKILPWVNAFRERRKRRKKHPVHDFLFEYYQCRRSIITHWHPPAGVVLEGHEAHPFLKDPHYSKNEQGVFLDPELISDKEKRRMEWVVRLIEAALCRREQTHCYGLHEWAMVYKTSRIRHETTPLRLKPEEIERVIESSTLRCTHYDAFRFFTDQARPLNTAQPRHEERKKNEQFGCVHFNMDLFKWCYKLSPWISSDLLLDCFLLAVEARELDMRASPYDLSDYGYEAIPIESPAGRATYRTIQKEVGNKGRVLASRLLEQCSKVLHFQSKQEPFSS